MNNEINNLKSEVMKKENNIYLHHMPTCIAAGSGAAVGATVGAVIYGSVGAGIGAAVVGGIGAYAGETFRKEQTKINKEPSNVNKNMMKNETQLNP